MQTAKSPFLTRVLIGINSFLFLWMSAAGVDWREPTTEDILSWGGSYAPVTLGGQWWRLISSMFVHIGLLHLIMNMYILWSFGSRLESFLGRARFISIYLLTGIASGIWSCLWHADEVVISAGASGAIFGLTGAFLALLTTNCIASQVCETQLKNVAMFVCYNLFFGLREGVDNAAHIGGLVSGLVLGYVVYLTLKFRSKWVGRAVVGLSCFVMILSGGLATIGYHDVREIFAQKDAYRFFEIAKEIDARRMEIAQRLEDGVETGVLAAWRECQGLVDKLETLELNPEEDSLRMYLRKWIALQTESAEIMDEVTESTGVIEMEKMHTRMREICAELEQLEEDYS